MNLNDVRETVTDAYNFKIVGYLLKSDYYYFGVETKTEANGNSIEVITIEPKENLEQPMLYEGSVTYDAKTKLILDIDLKFSEAHKKYNKIMNIVIAKVKFNNYVRKTTFKLDGDKYILLYGRIKINAYIKFGKKINNTLESSYDVTTLDYKEGEFKLDKDKKYRVSSLFKNGNKYTEEFWKKYNVVLLNDAEEKIIKSLK